MTYREALDQSVALLEDAGVESAEANSRILMEFVCHIDLGYFLLHGEDEMPKEQAENYLALTNRRCTRIPLQHLMGEQEFMGLTFRVNGNVLIPRQDTEILAEEAVRILKSLTGEKAAGRETGSLRVLDICTGTGCIAISIKAFYPDAAVFASDISGEALLTARENADINRVDIEWIQGDLFSNIDGIFDVITCNPPYIPTDVIDTLMPEVRDYEPRLALDGGDDGLIFYRRILAECGPYMQKGGFLLMETGSDQAGETAELMRENGFGQVRILKDLSGLDRVVEGRRDGDV